MKFYTILCFGIIMSFCDQLNAQMINQNGIQLFGHEWIDYDIDYYKIEIGEDGVYEIDGQTLINHGISIENIRGDQISIFHNGTQIPVSVSSNTDFKTNDIIQFQGFKNRGEVDKHLYQNPNEEQLNPNYSLITDTSAYFLCFNHRSGSIQLNEINNNLINAPQAESFYIETITSVYSDYHFKRKGEDAQKVLSIFDTGEGFAKKNSREFLIQNFDIYPTNKYDDSNAPGNITIRYTSNIEIDENSNKRHEIGLNLNNVELAHQSFEGIQVKEISGQIENDILNEDFVIQLEGKANSSDYVAIASIQLKYPRQFLFNQLSLVDFDYQSNSLNSKHFSIRDFDGSDQITVWDLSNNTKINVEKVQVDNSYSFVLPKNTKDYKIVCFDQKAVQKISNLTKRTFQKIPTGEIDYAIISHPFFNNNKSNINPVQAYADYRSSIDGGGFKAEIFNIELLNDMFAYGIKGHPLSIRNLVQLLYKENQDLKNVLLLGKGRVYDHPAIRGYRGISKEHVNTAFDFIPTYGSPGSDVLLSCDLQNLPLVPLGRISSINKDEIMLYLEKVKQHEELYSNRNQTIADKAWMKESIHLSGGDPSIFSQIKRALNEMGDTLETGKLGGHVTTFLKESTDDTEKSQSQTLIDRVNSGVSILTFFGHSNFSLLDFNIDDVERYENRGRYHMFIAMGCYAGNTFNKGRSNSEKNTLVRDKGAILYLANSTAETIPVLKPFAIDVYRRFATTNYGQSIGNILKNASIERLNSVTNRNQLEQIYSLTFHGDPAIKYPLNPGPDYVFDQSYVRFLPNQLNAELDSFNLSFSVVNIGAFIKDSIVITIQHKLPSGSIENLKTFKIATPSFRDSISVNIPISKTKDIIGLNTFYLTLDANEDISELPNPEAESNNELYVNGIRGIRKYISANDIQAIYPQDFSIVNTQNLQLSASSDDAFAESTNIVWQLDTTSKFNSPIKIDHTLYQTGGVYNWRPNIPLMDNTVYYWRVSKDSTDKKGFVWKNRSFIYLPNSSKGWNQSHNEQFIQDKTNSLIIDKASKTFEFAKNVVDIKIKNVFINNRTDKLIPRWFFKNETIQDWTSGTVNPGVYVSVINPVTGDIMVNPGKGTFGNYGNSRTPYAFPYKTENEIERTLLINFLNNNVPDNHIVILYTIQRVYTDGTAPNYKPEDWGKDAGQNLMSLFESQGATRVRELETIGSVPYILVYQKNNPSFKTLEGIGNLTDKLELQFVLPINRNNGNATTDKIGPSKSWNKFIWNPTAIEMKDDYFVDIIGITNNQTENILYPNIQSTEQDLSQINSDEYPYLRLDFKAKDTFNHTAVRLNHWRIVFEGLPDAAIDPNKVFSFFSDTLNQGDDLRLKMNVQNPTDYNMDSLLVEFNIIDKNNQSIVVNKRFDKLSSQDVITLDFEYNVSKLNGDYTLQVILNPNNDQPELIKSNNLTVMEFFVKGDKINPILNVTFDGLHIMDGDLVSSNPEITISLSDENQFLALDDNSIFELFLSEDYSSTTPLDKNDPDLRFVPAKEISDGKNKAKIIINKSFTDGTYYLRVRATDRSGNSSGQNDYLISFKVITKSTISNVINYPNPFTTSTKFVYTLTGGEIPDFYLIRILTASGKVVREINQEEIGPLYIGTHTTDYAWNGTDEWGDPLATGVYIYQFVTKNSKGEAMDLLETQDYHQINKLNTFFKNGWGKMVLLR